MSETFTETHSKRSLQILRHYQKAAIDFSRRNRLLKFPLRATKVEFELSLEKCHSHFGALNDLRWIFNHKRILKDEDTALELLFESSEAKKLNTPEVHFEIKTSVNGKKLLSTLEKLRLANNKKLQEHGLHTLFMVFGEVCWKEHSDVRGSGEAAKHFDFIAPLLLIPIALLLEKSPCKATVLSVDTSLNPIQFYYFLSNRISNCACLGFPNLKKKCRIFAMNN
jgi:hypothetical protein